MPVATRTNKSPHKAIRTAVIGVADVLAQGAVIAIRQPTASAPPARCRAIWQPVELDRTADQLGIDREPLLGARGAGMPVGQDRQVDLRLAVDRGRDMNMRLVMQQLDIVAIGEAGVAADSNRLGGGQRIGGERIDQVDARGLVAEVLLDRDLETLGNLGSRVIGRRCDVELDAAQLGDGLLDLMGQLRRLYRQIAQGGARLAVEQAPCSKKPEVPTAASIRAACSMDWACRSSQSGRVACRS